MWGIFRQASLSSLNNEPPRVIKVGRRNATEKGGPIFCDNSVVNSKYTVVNFVPRSLFEQFRRLANVYFLVMGGLMLLGTYSPVFKTPLGALTTLLPLSIVLVISMVQEGLADVKRHKADDETNNRPACATTFDTGGTAHSSEGVLWRDIQVGDVLKMSDKQPLPADVMLLYTSEDEHVAYIETSQIDGETNLKLRRAVAVYPHVAKVSAEEAFATVVATRATIDCEGPNTRINSFTGVYRADGGVAVPIDIENVILRGSVLRNTRWAYGVVVYTGRDTKLQRNSRAAPSKMSRIDDLVNRAIYVILLLDLLLVTISTLLLMNFEANNFAHLSYLGFKIDGVTTPQEIARLPDGVMWQSHQTSFTAGWLTFFVLFNNFVPISMYVTLEVITYFHLFLINEDLQLYHPGLDMPAKARSNNVTDLGQVEYIFSDKTGTLTENVMKFKRCSIDGTIYGAPVLQTPGNANQLFNTLRAMPADAPASRSLDNFLKILALCHTVVVEHTGVSAEAAAAAAAVVVSSPTAAGGSTGALVSNGKEGSSKDSGRSTSGGNNGGRSSFNSGTANATGNQAVNTSGSSSPIGTDPIAKVGGGSSPVPVSKKGPILVAPRTSLVVSPLGAPGVPVGVEYQAESPDEKALVEAAAEFGYVLMGRTTNMISVCIAGRSLVYEPLAVNKFDSDRKRMSILLREPGTGSILLLCKGADTSMLSRGIFASPELKDTYVEHLRLFSEEGLRTLVLGCRELSPREFSDWLAKYTEAALSDQRAANMSRVADEIEKDLNVVGITAIEDKLQEGVPDTIANLAVAGIKVCVLTGDKMETAINIGYSCKVLREGMLLLQLGTGSADSVEHGLCQLYQTVMERHPAQWSLWENLRNKPNRRRQAVINMLARHFPSSTAHDEPTAKAQPQARAEEGATAARSSGDGSGAQSLPPPATPSTNGSSMMTDGGPPPLVSRRSSRVLAVPSSPRSLFRALEHAILSPAKVLRGVETTGGGPPFAFIMEGPALVHVLGNKVLETMLFEVMQRSIAVIACRVSPKQKALLVRLVKHNVKPVPVTLAIGDGANDVGMIQEAHVGVGISGNEGQQAVNASDFAVAQFRFLQRLLLVHGRWNYRRMCKTVLYSFYKNLVLVVTLFFFLFQSGFAGTSLYEDNILAGYNFFLGLQILTLGLFDKDISANYAMRHPKMYVSGRENMDLNSFQVVRWIITALLHGFFVYYLGFWLSNSMTRQNQTSFVMNGQTIYTALILLMNSKVLLEFKTITYPGRATRRRPAILSDGAAEEEEGPKDCAELAGSCASCLRASGVRTHPETQGQVTKVAAAPIQDSGQAPCAVGWTVVFWVGSLVLFFFVSLVYNAMVEFEPGFFGAANATYSDPLAWLIMALIPVTCLTLDVLFETLPAQLRPTSVRLGIEENRLLGVDDWE